MARPTFQLRVIALSATAHCRQLPTTLAAGGCCKAWGTATHMPGLSADDPEIWHVSWVFPCKQGAAEDARLAPVLQEAGLDIPKLEAAIKVGVLMAFVVLLSFGLMSFVSWSLEGLQQRSFSPSGHILQWLSLQLVCGTA